MAAFCCAEVQRRRRAETGDAKKISPKTAYFFDQFKRKEEIDLLRQIYGAQFVVISLYSDRERRTDQIAAAIANDHSSPRIKQFRTTAENLITRDQKEEDKQYGQRLEDAFPSADLFLDLDDKEQARVLLVRFLDGLFGSNSVSPTYDEFGMQIASTSALLTIDLSRQVGAALCTNRGDILATGCNEVPKAHGGIYGTNDTNPFRDAEKAHDSNERIKKSLLADFTKHLSRIGMLKDQLDDEKIEQFIAKETSRDGRLRNVQLMDLIEFGRMVHAEMCAICESARLGKSIDRATLFCTTFPCHLCAKLIIAAGITRVVYIEPYPKSYAEEFHREEIHLGRLQRDGKVMFEPFIGIAPRRYQSVFSRGRRKDGRGEFQQWADEGGPQPIIRVNNSSYIDNENAEIAILNAVLSKKEAEGLLKVV